jgi:hypothetical protein
MKRNTTTALVLCLAMVGTAVEARAECQYVRGSIAETNIPSPNDPLGRLLGNVTGVLNGASTVCHHQPTSQCEVIRCLRDEPG